ncbi:MAG: PilZ domain-containing protein [Lachnospiraceae bacterium]|nr:PilZ domain-containing protein [Lachnospiraceae bacterium]
MNEKRRSKRLPIDLKIVIVSLKKQGEGETKPMAVPIEVSNISKGGLGFEGETELHIHDCFSAALNIGGIKTINAVLRIIRKEMKGGSWYYGCEILGHPSVYDYVFDEYEKAVSTVETV